MKQTISKFVNGRIIGLLLFLCTVSFAQKPSLLSNTTDSSQIIADQIVQSKIPVLIDFWAVWCAPCKILDPIISELEKEYKGKVLFIKVDSDIHKAISEYFQVQAIPSVFLVNDRKVVNLLRGVQPKEAYVSAINEVLELAKKENAAVDSVKR